MKKMILIGTALLLITLVCGPVFAKRSDWSGQNSPEGQEMKRVEHLKLLLDLTPEQETQIRAIIQSNRKDAQKQGAIVRSNHEEVRQLMAAETLDETRVRELLHAQAEMKAERMIRRHATKNAINQVLTPEQQEKSEAMRQLKHERKRDHFRAAKDAGNQKM